MQNNLSTTAASLPASFGDESKTSANRAKRSNMQQLPHGWWVPVAVLFAIGFWGSVLWWLFG